MSKGRSTVGLLAWTALCFGAAAVGSIFTRPAIPSWYANLAKPPWTPPNEVFGPVWSALYLMMALAAWLVWRRGGVRTAAWPLGLFAVQLALNAAWSALFFGLKMPGAAFAEILALWFAVGATAMWSWRWSRAASALLAPYLGWVTFAAALNLAVWRMNP